MASRGTCGKMAYIANSKMQIAPPERISVAAIHSTCTQSIPAMFAFYPPLFVLEGLLRIWSETLHHFLPPRLQREPTIILLE